MYTKSIIQQINESISKKQNFYNGLTDLMEKYNIEDSIFLYNNVINEATTGYFEISNEYDNLKEAVKNYKFGMGIRIINNNKFQIGDLHKTISECNNLEKILDIDKL